MEHYVKGEYPQQKVYNRHREWIVYCNCGASFSAFGKQLARCKLLGHQETMLTVAAAVVAERERVLAVISQRWFSHGSADFDKFLEQLKAQGEG